MRWEGIFDGLEPSRCTAVPSQLALLLAGPTPAPPPGPAPAPGLAGSGGATAG